MSNDWHMTHSINRRLTLTVIFTASASLFLACLAFLGAGQPLSSADSSTTSSVVRRPPGGQAGRRF